MRKSQQFDDDKLFSGFMLGILLGGIAALFKGPRIRINKLGQTGGTTLKNVRSTLDKAIPSDPVKDSIAEGKEAARRRQVEQGLDRPAR